MPRPSLVPLLATIFVAAACDDGEATRPAESRHQELVARLGRVEAQASALEAKLKSVEESLQRLSPAAPPTAAAVLVEVTPDGLRVGEETLDLPRFEELLRGRLVRQPDLALTVKAGAKIDQARVLAVLDAARSAGVAKVAISNEASAP